MPLPWDTLDFDAPIDDLPLSELYTTCLLAHNHISDLPATQGDAQRVLDWVLTALRRCEVLTDVGGLISDNEDKDDVATPHLRYLLVSYLMGEFAAQTREREPRSRLFALSAACRHYNCFLKVCRDMDLLDEVTRKALDRLEAGEEVDPRLARTEKLERKRREMHVEGRIKELLQSQLCDAAKESDANEPSTTGGTDEESERELWMLKLEHACIRSVEQLRCLAQEQEILLHMARRSNHDPDDGTLERERAAQAEAEEQKAIMRAKLLNIAADIKSTAQTREQQAAQVFRPSHILPTYSVEQAGMMELRQAQEREARSKAIEAERAARLAAVDEETLEEEELQKQRAWDDWVDDHPAGYGNSKLRPCAL